MSTPSLAIASFVRRLTTLVSSASTRFKAVLLPVFFAVVFALVRAAVVAVSVDRTSVAVAFLFVKLSLAILVVAVAFETLWLALVNVARVWQCDHVSGVQGLENAKRNITLRGRCSSSVPF